MISWVKISICSLDTETKIGKIRNVIKLALRGMSSCACLLAVLAAAGCMKSPQNDRHDDRLRHAAESGDICGMVGNITMRFPSRYTFLGVTYVGVDYWGGKGHLNDAKWCDDQFLNVPLSVTWPEMAPAGGDSWFTSDDPRFIVISIEKNMARDPHAVMAGYLESQSGDGFISTIPRGREEVDAVKRWSDQLGLYMIDANTFSPGNRRKVYWGQSEDGSLSVLIVCEVNIATVRSHCSQTSFDRSRDVWLTIKHRAKLLPEWRDLNKSAFELVDKFTIEKKE